MKNLYGSLLALSLMATPVLANSCPTLIKKAQESRAQMEGMAKDFLNQVDDLIAKAQKAHEAGKHKESVAAANEAIKLMAM